MFSNLWTHGTESMPDQMKDTMVQEATTEPGRIGTCTQHFFLSLQVFYEEVEATQKSCKANPKWLQDE